MNRMSKKMMHSLVNLSLGMGKVCINLIVAIFTLYTVFSLFDIISPIIEALESH